MNAHQSLVKVGELVLTASVPSPVYVHLATLGNPVKVSLVFVHLILASTEASAMRASTITGAIAKNILEDSTARTTQIFV